MLHYYPWRLRPAVDLEVELQKSGVVVAAWQIIRTGLPAVKMRRLGKMCCHPRERDMLCRMSISMSKLVREITGRAWLVYRLANHTKMEIYFGATKDYSNRFKEHAGRETETIKHWDFVNDSIDEKLVEDGLTEKEAIELEHTLDSQKDSEFPDYTVFKTGGR